MINGKSANFDRRLAKLENSKLGVPANLAGFRIPKITVHEGEDEDKIIKEMEARGEIPPPGSLPAGKIRVIVHRIISPPRVEQNGERYNTERYQVAHAGWRNPRCNEQEGSVIARPPLPAALSVEDSRSEYVVEGDFLRDVTAR